MKTRNGFVSNSSSSSFVVMRQDVSLSEEELVKNSILNLNLEKSDEDELAYFTCMAMKFAEQNKYILFIERVEYGGESCVEKIVEKIFSHFKAFGKDLSYKWEE